MSETLGIKNIYAIVATLAWLAVPALWGITSVLDRTRRWEDSPMAFFLVGAAALALAGVFTFLAILRHTRAGVARRGMLITGYVFYGLGFAVTAVLAWAAPLWMILYGVALLLIAAAVGRIRPAIRFMAIAMLAAVAVQIGLTALKLGTPDTYGDYPIAWTTALLIATLGAAAGTFALSRYETDTSEQPSEGPSEHIVGASV